MTRTATITPVIFLGFLAQTALGFSSDNCALARSFNQTYTLTNTPILVTATFTNVGTNSLRGFFYSEQAPAGISLEPVSVILNGQIITNYIFESGQLGDVYAGCTPQRWVLESPINFIEANPIPPQATLQITYAISAAVPGSFCFQQFAWASYVPGVTNASFGYAEDADSQTVSFLTTSNPPVLLGQYSTNGFLLLLQGVPETNYIIEASSNLLTWVPLVTNASSFAFTDTNALNLAIRFYRGKMLVP